MKLPHTRFLGAAVAAFLLVAIPASGADPVLRLISQDATTVTLGWDPVNGAEGFRFSSSATSKRSHTWDGNRTQVRFAKADSYMVERIDTQVVGVYPGSPDPPPPPPPANAIQPGDSWQAAYNAAPSGAVLMVAAGNHGTQGLAGTKPITFQGVDGARLTELANNASNVTLDNVDIDGDGRQRTILVNAGDNNTYRNLEIRDNTDVQMVGNNGSNGTYDNVVFHDAVMTPAGENAGVHMECVWSNGPGLTVRNSRFYNCAVMDLFLTRGDWWGQPNVCCITLEDNTFEPSKRTSNQGTHFYGLGIHDNADNLDRYTVKRNRFDQPVNNTNPALPSSVFCGNTGQAPASWKSACG